MLNLQQIAQAVHGQLDGVDTTIARVHTDTRTLQPGDLFVALRGERFDGHDYVAQALAQGASAALVDLQWVGQGEPVVRVADTRLALGALGQFWRHQHQVRIAAVTGSSGKTTVKDMLALILRAAVGADAVLATVGNLNNELGVPLTLLRLNANHRYAVVEMGMNHAGEIRYLTGLTQPDVALVNNAGLAHVEHFSGPEGIAHAKGEIYEGLGPDGVALIPAHDRYTALWQQAAAGHRQLRFGLNGGPAGEAPDLVAGGAEVSADYRAQPLGSDITMRWEDQTWTVQLAVPGEHNVRNALAAAAAALALGVSQDAIRRGLEAYQGSTGRLQRRPNRFGGLLIDDTYNANPASVRAAVDVLADIHTGPRVLVLGDLGELGERAADEQRDLGAYVRARGIEQLLTLGDNARFASAGFGAGAVHHDTLQPLLAELDQRVGAGVALLVKGSRFMRMERVVAHFASDDQARGH